MKKVLILLIAMLLVCVFSTSTYAESPSTIPKDALKVANDGLESIKDKMTGDPKRWGFTDAEEIKRLELSEGLHVNYIDGDKLSKTSGKSMIALIDPNKIETWEFTLDLDGNPKVFLTVAFEDGTYRIVHFGGNAETFGVAKNDFKLLTIDMGTTVTPTLLRIGPTYYLVATIDNNEYVLPVISDSSASKMATNELKSASEIIEMLKDIQQNSLEGERGGSSVTETELIPMSADQNYTIFFVTLIGAVLIALIVLLVCRRSRSH